MHIFIIVCLTDRHATHAHELCSNIANSVSKTTMLDLKRATVTSVWPRFKRYMSACLHAVYGARYTCIYILPLVQDCCSSIFPAGIESPGPQKDF